VWARVAARWALHSRAREIVILAFDAMATLCSLYGALLLRFGGDIQPEYVRGARIAIPLLVFIRLGAVISSGVHRWSFRVSGLSEAARLAGAMFVASVVFAIAFNLVVPYGLPRSVYVLEFFLTLSLMAALRFSPRILEQWRGDWERSTKATTMRTIIVGAGRAGDLLARDLIGSEDGKYLVVGFVDDEVEIGTHVSGKPVLGTVSHLPRLIERFRISTVLLAIPNLPAERVRAILRLCASSKASFKTIPASYACLDNRMSAAMLHDLSPDDLLGRDPIAFDCQEIRRLVHGRNVLVTGAGGTIGGEICRQLALHGVSRLVMVDMNENELYLRTRSLQVEFPSVELRAEVADIRELARLQQLGEQYEPEYVFHAAAHKHVPLMEDAPAEAVKNNVFGTLNVALMAHQVGAERLVVISTDKAVNPTSVMGATKRIAELITQDLARRSETRMTAVRFGNVLGSAGSVVPLFKQQIERGGPVTVTHPDCTRYFMTVSEAVGLVLLAGLGDYGDLCVLDMGKPIRIAEMAANLITMAGRIPGKEIPIVFTGLRPGEKLYEELLTGDEEETVQVRDRISVAKGPPVPLDLARQLSYLREFADEGDRERLLDAVQALVPSYRRTPGQPAVPAPCPPPPGLPTTVLAPSPALAAGRRTRPEPASPPPLAGASPHSTAA
jgi:FlaA1/EpsC-like NDP-sugar epimerase